MDYFDKDGEPLDMVAWSLLMQDRDYSDIAKTTVNVGGGKPLWVSTVWLGLDHSFVDHTRHIFETMLFGEDGEDYPAWRWCSEDHARAGHARVVAWLGGAECPGQCWGHLSLTNL